MAGEHKCVGTKPVASYGVLACASEDATRVGRRGRSATTRLAVAEEHDVITDTEGGLVAERKGGNFRQRWRCLKE